MGRADRVAVATVQTMLLLDLIGYPRLNALLGTMLGTTATADTGVGNPITFFCDISVADSVALPKNRVDTQIEIFNFRIGNFKYNPS